MLEKNFHPKEVENRLYQMWEKAGAFRPSDDASKDPYCIVIPPPNVTGRLHMGHALNNALQDCLIRFERMRGKAALWQPGTDHAGIATQMIVERKLMDEEGVRRLDIGREAFLDRVWQWKAESGGMIVDQLRRLGATCDWSRERFTMDEGLSRAVREVFVRLYRDGLIYRDKRLVNWHPDLKTALSDLEVENIEVEGHMWHFGYPIADQNGAPTDQRIVVATTRPETMLGDTAVAVHPDDERYKHLIGSQVRLPLADRLIPIVGDPYADPEQGSGAVKITPAHDFNDFEVGRRHDLPQLSILDEAGRINDAAPEAYHGLDRFEARDRVVADMRAGGFLEKIDPHTHTIPFDEKSKSVVIEPLLTDQWYLNAEKLAQPAIEAVEAGRTQFVPRNWERTYFEWMRNIQPWCISRQLWWGHQIPAWYGPDDHIFVAETEAEALSEAARHYGADTPLIRDPDVLDTWFSSGLWPFSTLGWPDETAELNRFYKTDVLVTAFDIIFFWVARMMMMGLYVMKDVPFHTVYIHALVRDEHGQKMSKTKGNVIDPLELIDEYGADALRFTLLAMAAQGRDIKLAKSRVEGYRNFGTKLWNAARFCEMNECIAQPEFEPGQCQQPINRWMIGEVQTTALNVTEAVEGYRFNDAAGALYRFVWNVFCDWYLELIKPLLNGDEGEAKRETRAAAAYVLDETLKLLHPFMPFLTEEVWQRFGETGHPRSGMLINTSWPKAQTALIDVEARAEMEWVIGLISEIRSVRSEVNIPAAARIPVLLQGADETTRERLERHMDRLKTLARLESIKLTDAPPTGSIQAILEETTVHIPLKDVIDIPTETERLSKEIAKVTTDIDRIDAKLGNEKFVNNAPEHVVETQRERREEAILTRTKLNDALKRLQDAAA
ncbi:MAG: valine--tRNA ligase [Pseudomonadota bacterium]